MGVILLIFERGFMFPYVTVFNREIGLYAICAIVGLFAAAAFTVFQTKRYKIIFEDVILIAVFSGVFALIGAHLLFGITQIPALIELCSKRGEMTFGQFLRLTATCFSGMVYYGGFLGAAFGMHLYTRFWLKNKRKILFDTFAVAVPLFHSFGRIGCFFGGCCYGIESRFGIPMPFTPPSASGEVACRFPVQLLEAALNLLLFFFLFSLYRRRRQRGHLFSWYLCAYPAIRFALEFLRGDTIRGIWLGFSTSQWISVILILIGAFSLLRARRGRRKR